MSPTEFAQWSVAGRGLELAAGDELSRPLLAWLGAAATPHTAAEAATVIRVEQGPVGRVPDGAGVLHAEPLVEVRGGSSGRRWFAPPGQIPVVAADLADSPVVTCAPAVLADPGPHLAQVALALLCALRATGLLPLHAGAVVVGGGAVLLVGPSGRGKSTAAARAASDGLEVIADDTILLDGLTVHGVGSGIRMRLSGTTQRPVLDVPRHGPLTCRAVVVLDPPGASAGAAELVPEPRLDVYAALLAATPVALDPLSLDATRSGLLRLAELPGFRCLPGSPGAPLRPALEHALAVPGA